jgi:hypothetical protein
MTALAMASLIRRQLRHAEAFVEGDGKRPPFALDTEDERIVGWYNNPKPWDGTYVVFTTRAIQVSEGSSWMRIAFDDVVDYVLPSSKSDATGVRVVTRDGFRFIRFAGRSGPAGVHSDAFALVGLLHAFIGATRPRGERG